MEAQQPEQTVSEGTAETSTGIVTGTEGVTSIADTNMAVDLTDADAVAEPVAPASSEGVATGTEEAESASQQEASSIGDVAEDEGDHPSAPSAALTDPVSDMDQATTLPQEEPIAEGSDSTQNTADASSFSAATPTTSDAPVDAPATTTAPIKGLLKSTSSEARRTATGKSVKFALNEEEEQGRKQPHADAMPAAAPGPSGSSSSTAAAAAAELAAAFHDGHAQQQPVAPDTTATGFDPSSTTMTMEQAAQAAGDQLPADAAAAFLNETFASFAQPPQTTTTATQQPPSGPSSTVVPTAPAMTMQDHVESLTKRVERDPRDGDAWLGLIEDCSARADLEGLRKVYSDFFPLFPTAARQWQEYAGVELSHSEFAKVEAIFTQCLRTTPSTDLWRFYLSYTRRVNPLPPAGRAGGGEESERETVRKTIEGAYEFALHFIGQSRDAGEVWHEYIGLLKERETVNQWQAGQKMDDIRRAYQRAVAIPLLNVEALWAEWDRYETGLNRITAKKFLADRSSAYMTARGVLREMRTLTEPLHRPKLPRVPCWAIPPSLDPIISPMTIARDRQHVDQWKKYLRWEEGNPLQLEDTAAVQGRVLLAYRKATMHMRFYPEIWYMAANYLDRNGRQDEAVTWLRNGLEACKGSSLLTFAFVEHAERHGQKEGCNEVFDALLAWIHQEIDLLQSQLDAKIASIDEEAERQRAEVAARKRDEGAADAIEGEEREELRRNDERREQRREAERQRTRPRVEELKEFASLVWIKFMHFARRTEGQRPSRAIFARARKSAHCTWQVFEANALLEYHTSKDVVVATKVFELALKTYGNDEAFVVRYLDFLLSINDDNNARALFERTVANFPADRARPIWDRWCAYEYSFGDTAAMARIEERLAQVYPDEGASKRLMDRNTYMDLDVVGPRDLGIRTLAGGASAAERATTASRAMAQESEGVAGVGLTNAERGFPTGVVIPTGPRADQHPQHGGDEPMAKRARMHSTTPPPSHRPIPTGPRGHKRSVSPPANGAGRFPTQPPTGPSAGMVNSPQLHNAGAAAAASPYLEIPDGILFLMNALPAKHLFDGPLFTADHIVECLTHSNILANTDQKRFSSNGPPGAFRGGRGGGPRRF